MKIVIASFLAAAATLLAMPASAQTQQQQPQQQTSAVPAAPAADPIICEKEEVTGSRLATRKVCMKRSQWQDSQLQDRQVIEKVQVQRPMNGNSGG